MPVDVLTSAVIHRPCAFVAAFAVNPDNAPVWYVNIVSVTWRTPRPARVGTRVGFVARFLGRRLEYTYEIVELIEGQRLVMRTSEGPFPMETTYTWESVDRESTRMTLRNRGAPTGFAAVVAPFMSWAVRRANAKDLARLKAFLEGTLSPLEQGEEPAG